MVVVVINRHLYSIMPSVLLLGQCVWLAWAAANEENEGQALDIMFKHGQWQQWWKMWKIIMPTNEKMEKASSSVGNDELCSENEKEKKKRKPSLIRRKEDGQKKEKHGMVWKSRHAYLFSSLTRHGWHACAMCQKEKEKETWEEKANMKEAEAGCSAVHFPFPSLSHRQWACLCNWLAMIGSQREEGRALPLWEKRNEQKAVTVMTVFVYCWKPWPWLQLPCQASTWPSSLLKEKAVSHEPSPIPQLCSLI